MKLILEVVVAVLFHPLAWVLMLLNLFGREDIDGAKKLIWAIAGVVWGVGPILYVTVGEGALW